jgi:hypothetical protein
MKFLEWIVGVMQILTGLMLAGSIAPAWRWLWITLAVFWFFVGATLGIIALGKLVAGKVGAGAVGRRPLSAAQPTAPQKEE